MRVYVNVLVKSFKFTNVQFVLICCQTSCLKDNKQQICKDKASKVKDTDCRCKLVTKNNKQINVDKK